MIGQFLLHLGHTPIFLLNFRPLTSPSITSTFLISGVLWSGALRRLVQPLTRGAVDPFVWTDCKFGYFLIYFGYDYSSALLIIISVEKFIALYFPLRTKTICTVRVAKRVSLATAIIVSNIRFPVSYHWKSLHQ